MILFKTLLSVALALSCVDTVAAQLRDEIKFTWNSVKLPFALSDIMANYMQGHNGDEDGFIVITGGCNSTKGNERISVDGQDLFACLDTSVATLKFDPFLNKFEELAPMLRPRQRHAAAVVNGELYVFGGRDSNDELVPHIDSFNPKTNTWTERGKLPQGFVTSDLTAWTWKNYIYVSGGFDANYTAVGNTYRFDLPDNIYKPVATSPNPRGDVYAVELYGYAYLAGGLTHASLWCEALTTTERYHMETDTWTTIDPLEVGRADMAVGVLNNKIVAVGGETKPDDCLEQSDPAYGSFPARHVDVLINPSSDNAKWQRFQEYPEERFRFAAAVVPAQNKMYTFGGQSPFDFTCDCFPTTDTVGVGTEVYEEEGGLAAGSIAAIVIGSLVGVILAACICRKCMQKRQREAIESQAAQDSENVQDSQKGMSA